MPNKTARCLFLHVFGNLNFATNRKPERANIKNVTITHIFFDHVPLPFFRLRKNILANRNRADDTSSKVEALFV